MVAGTRRPVAVAELVSSVSGASPMPDDPVVTAMMSEPLVPAPACTTTGASRTLVGTPANGAGKAPPRGSVVAPLRATASVQPKASRQPCT